MALQSSGAISFASKAGIATYTSEWTLGANGSSDYTFTGPGFTGSENDPTIYLTRGEQYKFTNNLGTHPFQIQRQFQNTGGTAYNDGIVNNGVSNGTLTWNVRMDAPDILYYQCTSHTNMSGKIYIVNAGIASDVSVNTTGVITATTFSGSGANLTSIPNSALTNDSVSYGGISLDLGQSDATPAFNLSDATNLNASQLSSGTLPDARFPATLEYKLFK